MEKALASKTGQVKYLQKGEPGDKGPMGPLLYPSGEYSSTATYIRTALSAAMVLCDKQYYALNKEGSFKGINPKTDYAANGNKATWVLMEHVMYAFYEMFMANFAKLASAVFYGQYMFSQQGTNAAGAATSDYTKFGTDAFTPNLMLDFLTGLFKGNKIDVEGKISTKRNGTRIEIDPETNSIRMYNQNNSVIGELTFATEEWNGSTNYLPRLRLRSYHNNILQNEASLTNGVLMLQQQNINVEYMCILNPVVGLSFYKNGIQTKDYRNL